MIDSVRTFIAIELPLELRRLITAHIARLRRELPAVRASWGREDNLHLTLKFLGNVPVDRIPALSDSVEQAAKGISPFELTVSECGTFPPHGLPKVLWIGTHASDVLLPPTEIRPPQRETNSPSPLSTLHSAIEARCAHAGFPTERRPFHPHLTIARLRSAQGARRLADLHKETTFPAQSFTVSEVVVFRSELRKEGSKYTALSRHELLP